MGDDGLFQLNDDPFMIHTGIAYLFLSVWLLPLYGLIMTALYVRDRRQPNITNKLMNIINGCEAGQAICHVITSSVLFFPNLAIAYNPTVRIFGCTANTLFIGQFPATTVLAISRILIFTQVIQTKKMHIIIKMVLAISYIWLLFVLLYGCISQNMNFYPPAWGYDSSVAYADLFSILELCVTLPCLATSYISYIVIAFLIYTKKQSQSKTYRREELAIMIQYTFVTTYITVLIAMWHNGAYLFEMTPFANAFLNSCWIVASYINPIFLLLLNKQIRNEVKKLLKSR
ncbi:unnamed protein product [Caenorhabditis bovis]|uniref:Uncharacterized protein n=1 Tax=Caenorhabditis bovis TaxID=2654633 RepID=A0A8S1E956_9PELO|nr:unnamed protein product [Caenorhabditis bovis]